LTKTRFARFRRAATPDPPDASEVPDNGFCLSVFLVLEPPSRSGAVLMGQLDPSGPWWEIGAVGPDRLARISERWMLPSRQLRFFEGPDEAALRILNEQLGSSPLPLEGPRVFSEASDRPGRGGEDPHWDVHFVYRGRWATASAPRASPWRKLEFVEVARTRREEIARGQGDVLELVGLRPRD
jgi:hypothetical protein